MKKLKEFNKKEWKAARALMSFFRRPVTNKRPEVMPLSLLMVYNYVRSVIAKAATEELRTITDHATARQYKGRNFDSVTPGGIFSYAADNCLVEPSWLLCIDLDYLGARVEELFEALINDPQFLTLLLFRSPSGFGLKWFIAIDLDVCDNKTWYAAVRNYLMQKYQLADNQVDKHCSNISRVCYLGHDDAAYIHPALLENSTTF